MSRKLFPLIALDLICVMLVACSLAQPGPVTDGRPTAWGPQYGSTKVSSIGQGKLKVQVGNCRAHVTPRHGSQLARRTDDMKRLLVNIGRRRTTDTSDCEEWGDLITQDAADLPQNQEAYPRERPDMPGVPRRDPRRG